MISLASAANCWWFRQWMFGSTVLITVCKLYFEYSFRFCIHPASGAAQWAISGRLTLLTMSSDKSSDDPWVVFLYIVISESVVLVKMTGIVLSEKSKGMLEAEMSPLRVIFSKGSKTAFRWKGSFFQFGMCAGRSVAWPAGTLMVSVATTRKIAFLSFSKFLW